MLLLLESLKTSKKQQNVAFREFENFQEATEFSIKQPINSIIEIKHYDDKTNNIQNEPNHPG